ncbi:hypothetical protein CHS0354_040404 [Potamilus streckersoni]|uniref:Uncharacterized protein n=1 Tax=Potamilus streckersoni TaxID=2493646 RepID=A0AAE0T001_9BIVA|nr:hypothetical protein CHS0354_040404 [Potamilus streckersoni]
MLINTVGVVLVAILIGTNIVTDAIDLYGVRTAGKGKIIRLREELSPFPDEAIIEAFSKTGISKEDIFVRQGSGDSSEEVTKMDPKSSEEIQLHQIIASSEERF